jgi:hypothetical protein
MRPIAAPAGVPAGGEGGEADADRELAVDEDVDALRIVGLGGD